MTYVYEGRVYEIDYVKRNENDDPEIFLIDPDTREVISVYDLPEHVADDLWVVCSDILLEKQDEPVDDFDLRNEDFDWGD